MSESPPVSSGLRDALSRVAASALALVQTRVALASVEFAEERERIKRSLVLVVVAAVSASFAMLGATLLVVAYFWDSHRYTAIALVTLFYLLAALFAAWRMAEQRRNAPTPFAATLAELEQDRRSFRGTPGP